jgi:hypothetical protein
MSNQNSVNIGFLACAFFLNVGGEEQRARPRAEPCLGSPCQNLDSVTETKIIVHRRSLQEEELPVVEFLYHLGG